MRAISAALMRWISNEAMSMTKSFTSILAEMLAAEGTLNEPHWQAISLLKLRQASLAARLCFKLWT